MKMKLLRMFDIACLLTYAAVSAFATTESQTQSSSSTNQVSAPTKEIHVPGNLQLYKFLPASEQTPSTSASANNLTLPSNISAEPQAAAPGLSLLGTQYVCAQATSTSTLVCENAMNEYLTTNTYPSTDYKVYVAVIMEGYGSGPVARMGGPGGSILPSSALVESDYLCTSSYTTCPASGGIVTGFRYWYDVTTELADGWGNIFYATSTGINNPSTTLSCEVQIEQ